MRHDIESPSETGRFPHVGLQAEKGESVEKAATLLGIGAKTVVRAKRIAKEAPDLLPAMRRGELTVSQAEHEVRMRLARASISRETEKRETKKRQENPREVKEYLDAIRVFRDAARTAKRVAAYGKFSPEAARFVKRWHDEVRDLLTQVEKEG